MNENSEISSAVDNAEIILGLKKKIKNLEEDLEDLEDDLSSSDKNNKKLKTELSTLQEQLLHEQREKQTINSTLEKIRCDYDVNYQELNLKKESLEFVQEVLGAPLANSDKIKELYPKIDALVDFISGDLRDAIKSSDCKLEGVDEDDIYKGELLRWANLSKKSWIKGKICIAFVGEFSAGKTSIVNRILSQDKADVPRLPVSAKATTAIPTYISGGASTRYQFQTPDNTIKVLSENTFKKVSKDVLDQVKGVSSLISYFVMTYKNENLNELSILDTPGFNSNDKEDAERTIGTINECDALFWVMDVNSGEVNKTSIDLIHSHLKKPLYIVINKVDTKEVSEVDRVERQIKSTLKNERIKVTEFIRFSEKSPLHDIMSPIKKLPSGGVKDSYLDLWSAQLNSMLMLLDDSVEVLHREYKSKERSMDDLINKFIHSMTELNKDCDRANGIPTWTEKIFSEDCYEMSKYDGEMLQKILDRIANKRTSDMANLYDDTIDMAEETQNAYIQYNEMKNKWRDMIECKRRFNKLSKSLKQDS